MCRPLFAVSGHRGSTECSTLEGPDSERENHRRGGEVIVEAAYSTLRRNEQPSVRRALPPVGWQRTVEQAPQKTTVDACEKTVVLSETERHTTERSSQHQQMGQQADRRHQTSQIIQLRSRSTRRGMRPMRSAPDVKCCGMICDGCIHAGGGYQQGIARWRMLQGWMELVDGGATAMGAGRGNPNSPIEVPRWVDAASPRSLPHACNPHRRYVYSTPSLPRLVSRFGGWVCACACGTDIWKQPGHLTWTEENTQHHQIPSMSATVRSEQAGVRERRPGERRAAPPWRAEVWC